MSQILCGDKCADFTELSRATPIIPEKKLAPGLSLDINQGYNTGFLKMMQIGIL